MLFYLAFPGFYIPHVRGVCLRNDNCSKVHVLVKKLQQKSVSSVHLRLFGRVTFAELSTQLGCVVSKMTRKGEILPP